MHLKKKKKSYLNSAFGLKFQRGLAGLCARVACVAQPAVAVAQRIAGVQRIAEPNLTH
jgi:hypothetical protein